MNKSKSSPSANASKSSSSAASIPSTSFSLSAHAGLDLGLGLGAGVLLPGRSSRPEVEGAPPPSRWLPALAGRVTGAGEEDVAAGASACWRGLLACLAAGDSTAAASLYTALTKSSMPSRSSLGAGGLPSAACVLLGLSPEDVALAVSFCLMVLACETGFQKSTGSLLRIVVRSFVLNAATCCRFCSASAYACSSAALRSFISLSNSLTHFRCMVLIPGGFSMTALVWTFLIGVSPSGSSCCVEAGGRNTGSMAWPWEACAGLSQSMTPLLAPSPAILYVVGNVKISYYTCRFNNRLIYL
mmetsp:Transcript_35613/g.79161  ORF Transcript_35613/g.79161 Transcript_35613/m.79161 type:complete len:300 (-) Transcript_35613:8-907(-)